MSQLVEQAQGGAVETSEAVAKRATAMKMLRDVVCKGHTDEEFQFFMAIAQRYNLDPMLKQIYSVKRWSKVEGKEVQSFQVGIDGFRILAHRTGLCAGIASPTFTYVKDKNGNPSRQVETATCIVKKILPNGLVGEFEATVWMNEFYVPGKKGSNPFYETKPHVQLGKVAEVHAIRRAFPVETGGIYSPEEFEGADKQQEIQQQAAQEITERANHSNEKERALDDLQKALIDKCAGMKIKEKGEFLFKVCMLRSWEDAKILPPSALRSLTLKVKEYEEPPPQLSEAAYTIQEQK